MSRRSRNNPQTGKAYGKEKRDDLQKRLDAMRRKELLLRTMGIPPAPRRRYEPFGYTPPIWRDDPA